MSTKISCGGFYIDNDSLLLEDEKLSVKNSMPEIKSTDKGKVLTVDETGVPVWAEASGSSGILVCSINTQTLALNKTWQQISDSDFAIVIIQEEENMEQFGTLSTLGNGDKYFVEFIGHSQQGQSAVIRFEADSANDYPIYLNQ